MRKSGRCSHKQGPDFSFRPRARPKPRPFRHHTARAQPKAQRFRRFSSQSYRAAAVSIQKFSVYLRPNTKLRHCAWPQIAKSKPPSSRFTTKTASNRCSAPCIAKAFNSFPRAALTTSSALSVFRASASKTSRAIPPFWADASRHSTPKCSAASSDAAICPTMCSKWHSTKSETSIWSS